jgi:hypothetical protein
LFTFEYPFTKVELNSARHYLAGRSVIYRPYIPIVVIGRPKKLQARGPRRALQMNTVLDSGADVCMFPEWVAHCLDLAADLQSAPVDRFSRVADEGAVVEARILEVVLEITHPENREFGFHQ